MKKKAKRYFYKHLLVLEETHKKVIQMTRSKGMTVDGLLKSLLVKK